VRAVVDHDDGDVQSQYRLDHAADRRLLVEAGDQHAPAGQGRVHAAGSTAISRSSAAASSSRQRPPAPASSASSGSAAAAGLPTAASASVAGGGVDEA